VIEKIKSSLKNGIDVNVKNSESETLPYSAALEGHKKIAEFFLNQLADINSKNSSNRKVLHAAAAGGHKDIVELKVRILI
jgi:ankyrin repeat protein